MLFMNHFDVPQKTITWARVCIDLGREAIRRYFEDKPFTLVIEDDPNSGEKITKIILSVGPTPEIEGHFTNALVGLKHSFDQSLFAAAQATKCLGFDKTYPWADTRAGCEAIIQKRQMKLKTRLPQPIIDEVLRQKPYSTGPGSSSREYLVREIAKMANDKHTIGFTTAASITQLQTSNLITTGGLSFGYPWDPVKKEMIISRVAVGSAASYNNPTISANVFFERRGMIGEVPVIDAATYFADAAQAALDGFKAVGR